MTDRKEWIGEWYIPIEDKEITFYGVLTYDPSETKYDILLKASSVDEQVQYFVFSHLASKETEFEYIKGIEHKSAKPILLLSPYVISRSSSIGMIITIGAGAIIEDYIVEEGKLNFDFLKFKISGLKEWIGVPGTDLELGSIAKDNDQTEPEPLIQVKYTKPKKITFNINDDFELEFHFSFDVKRRDRFNLSITEDNYLLVKSKTGRKNFYVLTNMAEQLRRLMSVLFNRACFLMEQSAHIINLDDETWEAPFGYNVYHRSNYGSFPIDDFSWDQMLFTYNTIKNVFPELLQKWFQYLNNNSMNYVHWVLSKHAKVFSEETFLERARALEVFHRATNNSKLYPDEIKNTIIEKIKKSIIVEDFANRHQEGTSKIDKEVYDKALSKIEQSLNFANEQSFSERLKNLFGQIKSNVNPEVFEEIFNNHKDLIWKIVSERNYYTHYSEDRKSIIINNEEQHKANSLSIRKLHKLTLIINKALLIVVLNDLGIKYEITAKRLSSKRFE